MCSQTSESASRSATRNSSDTIAAVATPEGRGGVGIVRISGATATDILNRICTFYSSNPSDPQPIGNRCPKPRTAGFRVFNNADGQAIDEGLVYFFPSPNSYTGEDVVELHGHGGPVVSDLLLSSVLHAGARLARPGEFTERAFLNDKLDLSQAEAVNDLINSSTGSAARAAVRSLQGEFSQAVNAIKEQLIELRVYMEAALDFPEEEIDFLKSSEMQQRSDALKVSVDALMQNISQGQRLRDGYSVVLAGKPNAGKSSVLNRLSGDDTAIVTPMAGTTRDLVRANVEIDGLPLQVVDTAGLRESQDPVEIEGMRRAAREFLSSDRILWIVDASADEVATLSKSSRIDWWRDNLVVAISSAVRLANELLKTDERFSNDSLLSDAWQQAVAVDICFNKTDLTGDVPSIESAAQWLGSDSTEAALNNPTALEDDADRFRIEPGSVLCMSAANGNGIDLLRQHLYASAGLQRNDESVFIARRRHIDALGRARDSISKGFDQLGRNASPELAAEDFREAQQVLSEITGEFTSDDLLGRIFAGFCIGK